jgi:enoyl-CoA hydratase/carnithine racemase
MPAYGGTQFLTSLLGVPIALDLLLTGRTVDVEEALRIGLISRAIAADSDVVEAALQLARSVAQFSFPAITAIRQAVMAAESQPTDAGMAREGQLARELFAGEDCREGVASFLEKRAPKFKGR